MIRSWPRLIAAVLGGAVALWLLQGNASGQQDEGYARVYVLTSGTVSAADHEVEEGYFSIGAVQIMVPPDGIPALRLRELCGKRVELAVRELK